jgi:hypothetical protein
MERMERIHFCSAGAPLCRATDARWCTILRDAVTCTTCLAQLAEREVVPTRGEPRAVQLADERLP